MRKLQLSIFAAAVAISITCSTSSFAQTAGTTSASHPSPPEHPITVDQIREIAELSHMRETMLASVHHTLELQKVQMPFMPEIFWKEFEEKVEKIDFIAIELPIFSKYLSEEDARRTIEFYKTPAGQHYLSVAPVMMQETMDVFGEKGREIGQEVATEHEVEIEAAAKKYQQDQQQQPATAKP